MGGLFSGVPRGTVVASGQCRKVARWNYFAFCILHFALFTPFQTSPLPFGVWCVQHVRRGLRLECFGWQRVSIAISAGFLSSLAGLLKFCAARDPPMNGWAIFWRPSRDSQSERTVPKRGPLELLCTLHFALCILHFAFCILHSALFTPFQTSPIAFRRLVRSARPAWTSP